MVILRLLLYSSVLRGLLSCFSGHDSASRHARHHLFFETNRADRSPPIPPPSALRPPPRAASPLGARASRSRRPTRLMPKQVTTAAHQPRPSVARIAATPCGGPVPLGTRKLEFTWIGSAGGDPRLRGSRIGPPDQNASPRQREKATSSDEVARPARGGGGSPAHRAGFPNLCTLALTARWAIHSESS